MVGCKPKYFLIVFYKAYIRSIIDYGSTLYGCASNSVLKRLDTVQNKALRICLGAMNSTPLVPLHAEASEPPLIFRRQFLSEKYVLKAEYKNLSITSKIAQLNIQDLTNKYWSKKNSPPLCSGFREISEQLNTLQKYSEIFNFNLDYFDLLISTMYNNSILLRNLFCE